MANNVEYTVIFGPEWKATEEALRVVDETLSEKFKAALEEAAGPTISELQRAALGLPAHGSKHTGLRGRIAAGVGIRNTTKGVRFTTSMPPGEEELPRGEDAGERGWRHPVYGDSNVWVHQRGGSWFRETISDDRPRFERSMSEVLDQATETIDRAGKV